MKDIFDEKPELFKTLKQYKEEWVLACNKALEHLRVVIEEPIITYSEDDVSADRLKSAVQTKKIAAFEYLDILNKKSEVEAEITGEEPKKQETSIGFAERNIRK